MSIFGTLRYIFSHPLNKGKKISALYRFFTWQISSRLICAKIAVPFVEETVLLCKNGQTGATGNYYCGLHEYEEMAFLLHFLREFDLFIDIGANIGSYSVLAAGCSKAFVKSFEPVPQTYQSLITNIKINNLENMVSAYQLGVSDKSGKLIFSKNLDTVNHVLTESESHVSVEVGVVTLDSFIDDQFPSLIKIDVEGYEKYVLQGAKLTLSNSQLKAIILEVNGSGLRYGCSDLELIGLLGSYGFYPFSYDPKNRKTKKYEDVGGNAIFIRDLDYVHSRTTSARKFKLVNGFI